MTEVSCLYRGILSRQRYPITTEVSCPTRDFSVVTDLYRLVPSSVATLYSRSRLCLDLNEEVVSRHGTARSR